MPAATKITDVFAKHGVGFCRYSGAHLPTTFMFRDEALTRPVGWVRGHKADGEPIPGSCFGEANRLHLIGAALAKAA